MNPLREWRRLRAVPDVKHEPSHSAGDERPSLAVVSPITAASERFAAELAAMVPPVVPVRVSARPGDPTPIFDAVMTDKWWHYTGPNRKADGTKPEPYHALATQFEVSFILDEFTDDDRAEIAREAAEDVDWGWGDIR